MKNKVINYVKEKIVWLLMLVLIGIYLAFGTFHLAEFVTADEHFWFYDRVPKYWKALSENNLAKTRINDKPGISVALIAGPALIFEKDPKSQKMTDDMPANPNRPEMSLKLNKAFRLPILIFNGLFSLVLFFLVLKITRNKGLSLLATGMMLFSPILLGISQIVNPDSLLWGFSAAAILSFAALLTTGEKKFYLLSPLFLALSLLSKYSASVLYPFLFAILLIYFYTTFKRAEKNGIDIHRLKFSLKGYMITVLASLVFFSIFMPAVFINFEYLLYGTVGYPGLPYILIPIFLLWMAMIFDVYRNRAAITNFVFEKVTRFRAQIEKIIYGFLIAIFILLILNALSGLDILRIHDIPFDIRQDKAFRKSISFIQKIFLEYRQIAFSLHPLILLGAIWIWFLAFIGTTRHSFLLLTLSLFTIVFYFAVISQGLLANIRYSIMMYVPMIIIGAIGIWDAFEYFKFRSSRKFWLIAVIFIFSLISLWQTKPFYFNYTNSLLPKKYIITGAWGYGGYEAAKYINSLEGSENFRVWTDYQGTCEFIKGSCVTKKYNYDPEKYSFDYFVFSRRGQILDAQKEGLKKPVEDQPIWELFINDREQNFIKVYRVKK